jgi:hypothetical protein
MARGLLLLLLHFCFCAQFTVSPLCFLFPYNKSKSRDCHSELPPCKLRVSAHAAQCAVGDLESWSAKWAERRYRGRGQQAQRGSHS